MRKLVVGTTLFLVLLLLNFVIYQKETHLSSGKSVFLKLAPVDPRSLMQGDYMALRFEIAQKIYATLPKIEYGRFWRRGVEGSDGFVVVNLDDNNVASYEAIYTNQTLEPQQTLLQYRIRADKVKFASNAFFFQEGTAHAYEKAKYGEFRVNDAYELLLVAMYDENISKITPKPIKSTDF
jgi:uncharacterized membrane-anchored protein